MVLKGQNDDHSLTMTQVEFFCSVFLSSQMPENPHQLSNHENCPKVKNRLEKYTEGTSKGIQPLAVLRRISSNCWAKSQMAFYIMEESLFTWTQLYLLSTEYVPGPVLNILWDNEQNRQNPMNKSL